MERQTETRLKRKKMFSGKIVDVYHDEVELPDGRHAVREVCVHPGAVVIMAIDQGDILFVRQYRHAVGKRLIELPAGKLEPGEDPMDAARRELREETGMECRELLDMGFVYTSPGILSEAIRIYYATDLTEVGTDPDDDEFIDVLRIPQAALMEMVLHGEITDAKTICAIAFAKARGMM